LTGGRRATVSATPAPVGTGSGPVSRASSFGGDGSERPARALAFPGRRPLCHDAPERFERARFREGAGMRPVDDLGAQLLRRGERLRIKARGGSMVPFLWDGDVAVVTPTAASEVDVGDVVCYEMPPGQLYLHRVIARDRDRVVAKGDALPFTEVVERAQLLGTVVAIERRGRVRRLDTPAARWRNRAIAFLSPALPRVLALAGRLRRLWRAALRG